MKGREFTAHRFGGASSPRAQGVRCRYSVRAFGSGGGIASRCHSFWSDRTLTRELRLASENSPGDREEGGLGRTSACQPSCARSSCRSFHGMARSWFQVRSGAIGGAFVPYWSKSSRAAATAAASDESGSRTIPRRRLRTVSSHRAWYSPLASPQRPSQARARLR